MNLISNLKLRYEMCPEIWGNATHTLIKQEDNTAAMIERQYSKLTAMMVADSFNF